MSFVRSALLCLSVAVAVSAGPQQKLPKGWKVCKRSDPQLNSCLQSATQSAILSMKNGLPSLGVLPIDPLHFDVLTLTDGSSNGGPVNLKFKFSDLDLVGIASVTVQKIKADWDKGVLEGYVTFSDPVQLIGNYKAEGKVLLLPVTGNGKCNLSFENFTVNLKLILKEFTKNNKQYFEAQKMTVDINTTRFRMNFENLFNGNKQLGDQMNVFVNENWEDILKELKPSISRSFGEAFRQIANRIFSRIPVDEIAPK